MLDFLVLRILQCVAILTILRWSFFRGFCFFLTDLLSVISWSNCLHLHVPVAAQVLFNLLSVPRAHHIDEVVSGKETRPVHVTPMKNTRRRCSWIEVYFAHHLLHFIVATQAPPRMCSVWPECGSTLCERPLSRRSRRVQCLIDSVLELLGQQTPLVTSVGPLDVDPLDAHGSSSTSGMLQTRHHLSHT